MGGNAFDNVEPIMKADVSDTVSAFLKEAGIPGKYIRRIGSSAANNCGDDVCGDIDLACSRELFAGAREFSKVASDSLEIRLMDGINICSVSYPQALSDRSKTLFKLKNGIRVQIDLMFVDDLDIAAHMYYSPTLETSKYRGIHRNELMAAIVKHIPVEGRPDEKDSDGVTFAYWRYQWNLNTGLQLVRKEWKQRKDGRGYRRNEVITERETCFDNLEDMIEFIFGEGVKAEDVLTAEQVVDQLRQEKNWPDWGQKRDIAVTVEKFCLKRKIEIPREFSLIKSYAYL